MPELLGDHHLKSTIDNDELADIVTIVVNDIMMIFFRSVLASARATTTLEAEGERLWMTTPRLRVVISVMCLY